MFSFNSSIDSEMKTFTNLMKSNSDRGRELFSMGQDLVTYAGNGNYRKFCEHAIHCLSIDCFPSFYFASKAFTASCLGQHLFIAAYILDNGYPINGDSGPNVLLEYLRQESIQDEECVSLIEFLNKYSFNVNRQEDKTWLAPIHIAVEKQLALTLRLLIATGADVNIVADKDIMPLNMAMALPESEKKNQILDSLISGGAKESWRRKDLDYNLHTSFISTTNITTKKSTDANDNAEVSDSKPKYVKFSSAVFMSQSEDDGGLMFSTRDN